MIEPYQIVLLQAERVAYRAGGEAKHKENMERNLKRYCDLIDEACRGPFAGVPGFSAFGGGARLVTIGEFSITGRVVVNKEFRIYERNEWVAYSSSGWDNIWENYYDD